MVFAVAGMRMLFRGNSAPSPAGNSVNRSGSAAARGAENNGGAPLTAQQRAALRKKRSDAAMQAYHKTVQPFLKKYCFECHGPDAHEAGLALHKWTDKKTVFGARSQWEKIARVLRSDAMPPKDHDVRPPESERRQITRWIEDSLFTIDCRLIDNPGRVTIRRLNRSEYNNTIRDLLHVDFQPAKDFPSDDVGYGFDNIGDVLSLPPLLMEKYLDAAEQIAERVIVTDNPGRKRQRRTAEKLSSTLRGTRVAGNGFRVLFTNGRVSAPFEFPQTGEYRIRIEAAATQAGREPARMRVHLDGRVLKTFDIKGHRTPGVYEVKQRVTAGRHIIAAAFINDYYNPKAPPRNRDRNLAVRFIETEGPLNVAPAQLPAAHRRFVISRPDQNTSVQEAAEKVFAQFLPRAFRRPVTPEEIRKYVKLVQFVVAQGESYERGLQVALQGVLVSPHFLFRIEQDPAPDDPDGKRRLNDFELATRLSYFLWSSMPDDELFRLAQAGKLHQPDVLEQQVRRMLQDPKSQALVKNFAGQWLNLRLLDDVTPDRKRFSFDEALRSAMRTETELFFRAVMREDRSILDFLDGNFTFVNERLAKHYGIAGVKGDAFRRVSLQGSPRAGVLTQASILTLTSNATRTSPVKRGKWILENIFDDPPPAPPPNVPPLDEKKIAAGNLSLRKQLEIHRANPVCASCHDTMDTLGFGFENFDAVGRWREKDGRNPVDASGRLPDGSNFNGPLELVRLLKKRKDEFTRCFVKKMLTFALGRGLEYYDKCLIDEISAAVKQRDYRFSAVVLEIVRSDAFQMRGSGKDPFDE